MKINNDLFESQAQMRTGKNIIVIPVFSTGRYTNIIYWQRT